MLGFTVGVLAGAVGVGVGVGPAVGGGVVRVAGAGGGMKGALVVSLQLSGPVSPFSSGTTTASGNRLLVVSRDCVP